MDDDERNREWIARLGVAHHREHGSVVAWGLVNVGADRLYASVRPPNPAWCRVVARVSRLWWIAAIS